jgi:hypothetical protein
MSFTMGKGPADDAPARIGLRLAAQVEGSRGDNGVLTS